MIIWVKELRSLTSSVLKLIATVTQCLKQYETMNNTEMKKIIIDQQELIVLLRNKLARLRGKYGEALDEIEFNGKTY